MEKNNQMVNDVNERPIVSNDSNAGAQCDLVILDGEQCNQVNY